MLEAGKKIGEYVLIEKIGRGAFGDVWLAEKRTALSVSQFALKFFRPATSDEFEIQAVQKEIEVWQKVSGLPNVISVIGADFEDDSVYIVSEYADGGSLQKWLAARGGKAETIEEAVRIILEILNGLDYLHRAGFIHRDLKPANVLVRKGTFCLADFGVTREIKTHSITLHTAGTYNYMPPEAFNKTPTVSPATDIWAAAVIFQELLTGKLPFAQTEIPALMYAILHDAPDPMPDDVPPHLRLVVEKALHKTREERFSTAREMIAALRAAPEIESNAEEKSFAAATSAVAAQTSPSKSDFTPINETARGTVVDSRFSVAAGVSGVAGAVEKISPPSVPSARQTVVLARPSRRQTKRNNLFVAVAAVFLVLMLGGLLAAVKFFSTDAAEFYERGVDCANRQNYDCALENYGKAIAVQPERAETYRRRAAIFYARNDFRRAGADYARAVELDPRNAESFYGRGTVAAGGGDFESAVADFTRAAELDPRNARYFFSRGLAFFNQKNYDRAIEDYTRAVELDPNYAEAFNNRGNALDERGDGKRAIEDYARAVELDPHFALAYSNRGTSYARQGSYARAVEDLTRALEINPNLASAYFNRANVFNLKNETDKALADYNRFIEINPNNAVAYSHRAAILGNRKNYTQAVEDFSRAVELDPQNADNYFNRALVYEKIGNRERAQSDRQRYNELRLQR